MKKIKLVTKDKTIPVVIGSSILRGSLIKKHIDGRDIVIITNTTIKKLYLEKILSCVKSYNVKILSIPDGERYKNAKTFMRIHDFLLSNNFDRNLSIIALGGGVIGDLVGFVASTFMRGVKLIHIPTTLLSQVDSSVGGKTAINHIKGKNLIGTFYQPDCVIIDTSFLHTLPEKEYLSGLAEVIKYGMIGNSGFLKWIYKNADSILNRKDESLEKIVTTSVKEKIKFVSKDERESNIRAHLNFGHTLGHAIEASMSYKNILHGQAISIGMLFASMISVDKNNLSIKDFNLILLTLEKLGLPCTVPKNIRTKSLMKHMSFDKKKLGKKNRFVLLSKLGQCVIDDTLSNKYLEEMVGVFRA